MLRDEGSDDSSSVIAEDRADLFHGESPIDKQITDCCAMLTVGTEISKIFRVLEARSLQLKSISNQWIHLALRPLEFH